MKQGISSKTNITIEYSNEDTARSVQSAVEPDNFSLPEGINIITSLDGSKLSIEVLSERTIGSLIVTLDDLLSCIQTAEQALQGLS
jgi:hypothetical protein